METQVSSPQPFAQLYTTLVRWSRKYSPFTRPSRPADLGQALERLAVTSPHLLRDLGFVPECRPGSVACTVWRRGGHVVTVTQGPPAVSAAQATGS